MYIYLCLCLPMPLIDSELSLTRKADDPPELLDSEDIEELTDVNMVNEDFFAVFCVAVRLHSVKDTFLKMRI